MSLQFPGFDDPADLVRQARRFRRGDRPHRHLGRPVADDLARAPVLDWWRPATRTAPALIGLVGGHPRRRNGATTMTSELFAIDADAGWRAPGRASTASAARSTFPWDDCNDRRQEDSAR